MDSLKAILENVLAGYTGEGLNGYAYLSYDPIHNLYTVISVGYFKNQRLVDANLIVRFVGIRIIIERDMNNKMLVDALLQAEVPRSQIILAYAGEPIPDAIV